MTPFAAELIGTLLLVTLGDGVVANVLLNQSKGRNGGWIVVGGVRNEGGSGSPATVFGLVP